MINNPKVKGSVLWNTCKNLKIVYGININMCIYQICAFSFTFPFSFRLPLWGHFLPLFCKEHKHWKFDLYSDLFGSVVVCYSFLFGRGANLRFFLFMYATKSSLGLLSNFPTLSPWGFSKIKKTNDLSNYLSCCTTHESDRSFRGAHCQNILISIRPKTAG